MTTEQITAYVTGDRRRKLLHIADAPIEHLVQNFPEQYYWGAMNSFLVDAIADLVVIDIPITKDLIAWIDTVVLTKLR